MFEEEKKFSIGSLLRILEDTILKMTTHRTQWIKCEKIEYLKMKQPHLWHHHSTHTPHLSWVQRKLSLLSTLSPLNILLSINGSLISFWVNGLND